MNKLTDLDGCVNSLCIKRKECLRYSGIGNEFWQSYSNYFEICKSPNYEKFIEME
jgi:hypothetical protein